MSGKILKRKEKNWGAGGDYNWDGAHRKAGNVLFPDLVMTARIYVYNNPLNHTSSLIYSPDHMSYFIMKLLKRRGKRSNNKREEEKHKQGGGGRDAEGEGGEEEEGLTPT